MKGAHVRFEEQLFFATVRVVSIGDDGKASLGTAFLVREVVDDTRSVILAVSNKHVLIDRSRNFILEFTEADVTREPPQPSLGKTVRFEGNPPAEYSYFEHPDPDVDLACLNVSAIGHRVPHIFHRTLDWLS